MNLQELIQWHSDMGEVVNIESVAAMHKEAVELLTTLLPPKKSADIEALPQIQWNAHAALHDALSIMPINAPCMVLWLDNEEDCRYRASCTNMQGIWLLHNQLKKYV